MTRPPFLRLLAAAALWAGGAGVSWGADYSLSFNGTEGAGGNYVNVPNNALLNVAGNFTVEALVFSTATASLAPAAYGKGTPTEYSGFGLGIGGDSSDRVRVSMAGASNAAVSSVPLPRHRWVHVAAVYDSSVQGVRLYFDGQLVASAGGVGAPTWGSSAALIGRSAAGGLSLPGALDEVRFWNVARTTAAIQADMRASLTGGEANLVALWKFDTGSGATAFDSTANALDGTLVNSPEWKPVAPRAITDLQAVAVSTGLGASSQTVTLTWSAPGDNGDYGQLNGSTYTVRWATFPMASEAAFGIAPYSVDVVTFGVVPGSLQGLSLTLDPQTTWYCVVRTTDSLSHPSALSNAATALAYARGYSNGTGLAIGVAAGDLEGDGDVDLVQARFNGGAHQWRNAGALDFTDTGTMAGTGNDANGVSLADLDRDGDLDVVVANTGPLDEQVLRNDGTGSFSLLTSTGLGESYDAAWGDYNNDGLPDFAAANYSNADEYVARNNGNGTFSTSTLTGTGKNSLAVAWGDYDQDGDLDLAVANDSGQDEAYARNNGDGTFSTFTLTGTAGNSTSLAWGDYDGDGDLDLAIGNGGGQDEVLVRNDAGTLTIASPNPFAGFGGSASSVAWGDPDGDGDLDLLVTNSTGQDAVYRNGGGGTFTRVLLPGTDGDSEGGVWADLDGDGDLDVAVATRSSTQLLVLRNDAALSLAAPAAPSAGFSASWAEDSLGASSGTLTLSWSAPSDDTTPAASLLYRVRVGTTSGGSEYLRIPPASSERGRSRVFPDRLSAGQPGVRVSSVPKGMPVYWAVLAEDAGYLRGSASAQQTADLTPPSAVTLAASQDSAVQTSSVAWVTLNFLAPGENGASGNLQSGAVYDVRWSSAGTLDTLAKYVGAPNQRLFSAAGTAGAAVSLKVTVDPGKTWHFALTTKDSLGSRSALSNSVAVYTPVVRERSDDAGAFSVLQGQTTGFLRLRLWTEGSGVTANLHGVRVRKFGTLPDAAVSNVGFYLEDGTPGFSGGEALLSNPAVFASSQATLTLAAPEILQNTTQTYFLGATIRSDFLPVPGASVSVRLDGEALSVSSGGVEGVDYPGLALDGVDDRVTASGAALDVGPGGQVTLEAWVRSTDTARANASIFTKTTGGNDGYRLWLGGGGCGGGVPSFFVGTAVLCAANGAGQVSVTDGRWHHVAAVYSNTNLTGQVFVDGVALATGSMAGGILDNAASGLGVGGPNEAAGSFFIGEVDEARVSNFTRYPGELPPLRRNSATGATLLYHFDSLFSDLLAKDASSNGLDGTLQGQAKGYARSTGTAVTDGTDTLFADALSLLPSAMFRNTTNVPVMRLRLWTAGDFITLDQLSLAATGSALTSSVNQVKLYLDDGDGQFSPTSDTSLTLGQAFTGGKATFSLVGAGTSQTVSPSTKTYFVAWNMTVTATNGADLGVVIASSADFVLAGSTDTVSPSVFPLASGTAPIVAAQALVEAESSTGTWLNVSSTVFRASFGSGNIATITWRWDQAPATQVDGSEPIQWASGKTTVTATADADNWYFHARAFDSFGSSGTQVDLGPFWVDRTLPAGSAFLTVDSTGGLLAETQFNDLAAGVTAQLTVQDAASGLSLDGPAPLAPSSGTVSLWHLDETAGSWADSGPAGNTLAASGAPGRGPGRFGPGLLLDGVSSAQDATPAGLPTGNAPRTVEAWLNLSSTQGTQGIAAWGSGANAQRFQISARRLGVDFGGVSAYFDPAVTTGTWHHAALTWDGAEARLFLDGVRIGTQAFAAQSTTAGTLVVGANDSGSGLRGLLDEVRVTGGALTDAQVAAAALRGDPYYASYSANAGQTWTVIASTVPAAGPYVALTGSHGTLAAQTLTASGLSLAVSTYTATGGLATNQVRFHFADRAGNVRTSGPFGVLVDTNAPVAVSTPSLPAPGTYAGTRPDFYWTAPSTTLVQGLGGQFFLQVSSADASFGAPNIVVSISTPAQVADNTLSKVTGVYLSTFTLGPGTTYYWRVRSRSSLGVFGPWGPSYGFAVDQASPTLSSFLVFNSTGGVFGEGAAIDLLAGVTVQMSASDGVAGLGQALDLSTSAGTAAYWRFSERHGLAPLDEAQGIAGTLLGGTRYGLTPFGAGLRLSGSGQYMTAPNTAFQFAPASTFTVSAWIKPSLLANQVIASVGAPLTPAGSNWVFWVTNSGALRLTNASGGGVLSPNIMATGTWQHVTVVQNGTRAWLYVNGVLRHAQSWAGNSGGGTMPFSVGSGVRSDGVTPDGLFTGDIDEVKVLSYAAEPAEVAADFARSAPGRFAVEYSTTAGQSWAVVSATFPGAGFPYVIQSGADGSTASEVIVVRDLRPVQSTTTATGSAGTNLLRFLAADRRGNFTLSNTISVLVDTVAYAAVSTPTLPAPGVFVSTRPNFAWDGPSTMTAAGMGAAAEFLLEVDDQAAFLAPDIAVTTPVVVTSSGAAFTQGVYLSTFTLAHGTTYYWRVRARDYLGVLSPALTVRSFVTDFSSPTASGYAAVNSTGGLIGEGVGLDLALGVTAQITLTDTGPGGFSLADIGAMYSNSTGTSWVDGSWSTAIVDGAQTAFSAMATHGGSLWAGTAGGKIWSYDGANWGLSTTLGGAVNALESFGGELYAGVSTTGEVHKFNGAWSVAATLAPGGAVRALESYAGRLYAGDSNGRVWGYEPTRNEWFVAFQSTSAVIESLGTYDGRLFAGANPNIYVFNGSTWTVAFAPSASVNAFSAYNRRLYAATNNSGIVYEFDGQTWNASHDPAETETKALAVHGGRLYAGTGNPSNGRLKVFDSKSWENVRILDAANDRFASFAVFGGRLYAGVQAASGDAQVFVSTPLTVAISGGEGGTGAQTLSVTGLNFAQSNVPTVCGGVAGCGATNQVRFAALDRAGRVGQGGPFSVLVDTLLSQPTGYYPAPAGRWVREQQPDFAWLESNAMQRHTVHVATATDFTTKTNDSGDSLNSPIGGLPALANGTTYYWRVRGVNAVGVGSSFSEVINFAVDLNAPSTSAYQHNGSTGGVLAESQLSNLASGATFQLTAVDAASGLVFEPLGSQPRLGAWSFEETGTTAQDFSSRDQDATLTSAGLRTSQGYQGGGLAFTGTGSVDVSTPSGATWPGMTIMGWVKPTQNGASSSALWATTRNKVFYASSNNRVSYRAQGTDGCAPQTPMTFPRAAWAHVAFVIDAGNNQNQLYVNGSVAAACVGATTLGNTSLRLGADGLSGIPSVDNFIGSLDEVRWFEAALSTAQIRREMDGAPFAVLFSSDAGVTWRAASSTGTAGARLSFTGNNGDVTPQSISALGLSLRQSTNSTVCGQTAPCGATNQLAFYVPDRAGAVRTAGPFAVRVDTSVPQPTLTSLTPAATDQLFATASALDNTAGSGIRDFLFEASTAADFTGNISSSGFITPSTYTFTALAEATTHFVRVWARDQLLNVSTPSVSLASATFGTVFFTTAAAAPASALQDAAVPMVTIYLAAKPGSNSVFKALVARKTGSAPDTDVDQLRLYSEGDGNGVFSGGDTLQASGALTLNEATLTLGGAGAAIGVNVSTFHVVMKMAPGAIIDRTVGLEISSATSVTLAHPARASGNFPVTAGPLIITDGANNLEITPESLSPNSVQPGTDDVPMLKLRTQADIGTSIISSMVVTLSGTMASANVRSVNLWRDEDANGLFNPNLDGRMTNDSENFGSASTATMVLTGAQVSSRTVTTAPRFYFVTLSLTANAPQDTTFRLSLASTQAVVLQNTADTVVFMSSPVITSTVNVILNNTLTVGATDQTPASFVQGERFAVLRVTATVDQGVAQVNRFTVRKTGTGSDSDVDAVEVWRQATVGGGAFNANLDTRIGTAPFSSTIATVDITTQAVTAGTSAVFFITYLIDPAAAPGVTLGVRLNAGDIRAGNVGTTVTALPSFPLDSSTRPVAATVNRMLIANSVVDVTPGSLVQGQQHVAMLRLDVLSDKNDFSWLGLSVERLGTAPDSAVSAVNLWRDADANGSFSASTDTRITGGSDVFSASTATLTLQQVQTVSAATQTYFVTVSVAAGATPGQTLGVRVSSTANFNLLAPNVVSTATAFPLQTNLVPVNQFQNTVTVTTTSIVPALGAEPGTTDVAMMALVLRTDVSNANWQSLRVDQAGTASDADISRVRLYYDFNDLGTFDSSNLSNYSSVTYSTQSFGNNGAGSVILTFTSPQVLGPTPKRYFLTVDLSTGATPARTVVVRASTGAFFSVNAPNQVAPNSSFTSQPLNINAPPVTMYVVGTDSAPATVLQGTPNVPMLTLKARTNAFSARWTQLRVTRTGTGQDGHVPFVKLYRDADGDGALNIVADERLSTAAFSGGTVLLSFATQTITASTQTFFVTYDVKTTAAAGDTVGARIAAAGDLKVEAPDTVATAGFPLQSANSTVTATAAGLFVTGTNLAPGELKQAATAQVLMSLSLQTTQFALTWSALTVRSTGSAADSDITAISVWHDANVNGLIDVGTDTKITSGLNAFLGGTAVLSLSQTQEIGTAQKRYLITADIAPFAEPGRTFAVVINSTAAISVSSPNFVVNSGFPMQSDANATLRKLEEQLVVTPADLVGAGINQGATSALARLYARASRNKVIWSGLVLRQNGNLGGGEIDFAGVWRDADGNGVLTGADLFVGTAAFSGSQASVAFSTAQTVGVATQTYFLAVQPSIAATVGADVRLSVLAGDFTVASPDAVSSSSLPFNTGSAVILDAKTPSQPVVTDDGGFSSDFEGLNFTWSSSVGTGTLTGAFYAVGTTPGGQQLRTWTALTPAQTSVRATGFPLTQAATVYVSVRTQSSFGFDSPIGISDGILLDFQAPLTPAVTVTAGSGALLVTWTVVPGGPSGILGYLIEYRTGASPQWFNAKTGAKTGTAALIAGAAPMAEGGARLLAVSTDTLATGNSFQATGIPQGTVLVRVRAVTGSGVLSNAGDPVQVQLGPLPKDGITDASVYPNPFDSRKTQGNIHFVLPSAADVSVKVYSVFGRLIRTFSVTGKAGSNTAQWDGADDSGSKVSKGLYLMVLESGGARATVKVGVIH